MDSQSTSIDIKKTSEGAKRYIADALTKAFSQSLKPPPDLNLVEWADTYRFLPDNSAEAGRWRTSRVEVSREPMLSITNPEVQEVTVMSCIQLMKTELMINAALYYMHQEPSPIMYVAPKKETAEAWSKERLVKSVESTPVIKDIFSRNRRGQGNTILQKQFPGGQISIVSARNPTDLAMRACMIMLFDEIDKYPKNVGAGEGGSGGEGDPIGVAWGRATTFGSRAKKICACSPTVEGQSRIEEEYFKSDQREFHQACPHCDHAKALEWEDVHIPRDETTGRFITEKAQIRCAECGTLWNEADRAKSIKRGVWIAKHPEITWHHGYRVTSLASPFTPVAVLAKEFVDAQGNIESLKAFYNTRMARTWREKGEQPDWKRLYERREDYKIGSVPKGALMITCGVDVGKDYLTYEVVGWGRKRRSWSIETGVISGKLEDQETKEQLAALFDRVYTNEHGIEMRIEKAALDSGYNTQEVYSFCRWYGAPDRVVPIKGQDSLQTMIGTPRPVDINIDGQRLKRGIMLWQVGSSVIKEQLYRWLNADKPTETELAEGLDWPTGYCHFPMYDEEFFKQLTAEQFTKKTDNRGFHTYIWEKIRKDNHKLDCRVYARAASAMLQIDRMNDDDWAERERYFQPTPNRSENADKVEIALTESRTRGRKDAISRPHNKRKPRWIDR